MDRDKTSISEWPEVPLCVRTFRAFSVVMLAVLRWRNSHSDLLEFCCLTQLQTAALSQSGLEYWQENCASVLYLEAWEVQVEPGERAFKHTSDTINQILDIL